MSDQQVFDESTRLRVAPPEVHPKAAAAHELAVRMVLARKWAQKSLDGLVALHNLQFIDFTPKPGRQLVMTVAYSPSTPARSGDVLRVSTALFNPNDKRYSRFEGRFVAARNFHDKHYIQLRKPKSFKSVTEFLRFVFDC